MKTFSLYNGETKLLDLLVRETDAAENEVLRNIEAVQPPLSPIQGAFGSGLHQAGTFDRMVAMCNISSYASVYHARAALEAALIQTTSVRFEGWSLPIVAAVGVVEWQLLLVGFRAGIRLIPKSAHWRLLTGTKSGTGSQTGTTITGEGFVAGDVGRLLEFADGREALITAYTGATSVSSNVDQTVGSQAYTVFTVAAGLL